MSANPGEYATYTNPNMAPQKKSGCGKYVAIGCAGMLLLMIVGGFLAYRGAKGFISTMTEKYTDTAPLELPTMEIGEDEAAEVIGRLDAFTEAVAQNSQPPALVLNTRDINVLIHRHPDWTNMAGSVYVEMEDDRIQGLTSIPLEELHEMFAGRYLNGSAEFHVEMTAGRLLVFMESIEVGGETVPEEIMNSLRVKNLAEDVNREPETAAILDKLESITVRDGNLTIVPKTPSTAPDTE